MHQISSINKLKSIETHSLIYKRGWEYYLDRMALYILAAALVFYGVLLEIQIKVDGIFTGFLARILAPLLIMLGIYCIYRKYRESELAFIATRLNKAQNIKALKDFLHKYNYHIDEERDEVITVKDEHMMSFNWLWRKEYVFIVDEYSVYFNITKVYPVISPPVLFSHLILRSDLKKFFKTVIG